MCSLDLGVSLFYLYGMYAQAHKIASMEMDFRILDVDDSFGLKWLLKNGRMDLHTRLVMIWLGM